ncbi:MAG TPA: serine/threonine-protein kinase [Polyangiaceae bacterium]|jgi:serine/threonine protein kinase
MSPTLLGTTLVSDQGGGTRYLIDRKIGEGGTATAFLAARHAPEGVTPVVVKIVHMSLVMNAKDTAHMLVRKEAVALGRMNEAVPQTPFVVRLVDAGQHPVQSLLGTVNLPWVALEYVHGGIEGTTLEERVAYSVREARSAFDRERVARVLTHVCTGLDEVHRAGIVHRDLTPNNVLCCGFGVTELFKLSDFALARPSGMSMTFGAQAMGTPGYMSPEQLGSGAEIGPQSDIFGLAGLMYLVLTGEEYFHARNLVQSLATAQAATRRSLLDARGLANEFRADPALCKAIDELLAQASAYDASRRPVNARAFGASLGALLDPPRSIRLSSRRARINTLMSPSFKNVSWTMRHPPGDDRVLYSAGWDGDGRCLAATSRGIEYWNGTQWLAAPPWSSFLSGRAHCVARIGPGKWVLGGERMSVAEYSPSGVTRLMQGPEPSLTFTHASGNPSDVAVFAAVDPGGVPQLCAAIGGRWLKPLPILGVAAFTGIGQLDDERWLLTGRTAHGRGVFALYSPLRWEVQPLPVEDVRAYIGCACQPDRAMGMAVGAGGSVITLTEGAVNAERLPTNADLSAVAIDVLGRVWVTAPGEVWGKGSDGQWAPAWRDANFRAPFVSLYADVGMITALTVDGAVLESHVSRTELGSAQPRR